MSITTLTTHPQNKLYSCSAVLRWATAFIFCLSLASCNSPLYDQTQVIENSNWAADKPVSFEFEIQDTTQRYNIFLEVDYKISYTYQNAYCQVESFVGDKLLQKQLCSLELIDTKGKEKGDCGSENCVVNIPFIPNTQFNTAGLYKIILTQYTRNETLEGINSLRLLVENVAE